ncbi:MAG: hypothetical protein LLF76_14445 [Planctomycetaceae bacterium]|nr:hypothetical protein [Planctomycetaceae bacterium]
MKIFIIILAVISNLAYFSAFAIYPFIYVLKTGRFLVGSEPSRHHFTIALYSGGDRVLSARISRVHL